MIKKLFLLNIKVVFFVFFVFWNAGAVAQLPKIGQKAPNFSLEDLAGKRFSLSDLKDKKIVLLWFTNLCKGCQSKFLEMERIKNLYSEKETEVIAVSVLGDDRETVENTVEEKKTTFKFLLDPRGVATKLYSGAYHPGSCPLQNIFIIDKGDKITYASHYPGTEQDEIMKQLDKALKGKNNLKH